jgi:hypothetical protein
MKKLFLILAICAYTVSTNAASLNLFTSNAFATELNNDDKDKNKCCKKGDKEKCCKKEGEAASSCKKGDSKEKCCKKDAEGKSCKKDEKKAE